MRRKYEVADKYFHAGDHQVIFKKKHARVVEEFTTF